MPPGSTAYVFGVHPFIVDSVDERRGAIVVLGRIGGVHRASVDIDLLTTTRREV